MATFNGHKNWNHWNVALWINNDEGLYRDALDFAVTYGIGIGSRKFYESCLIGEKTPDGAPYSYSSVRAAMRGILD